MRITFLSILALALCGAAAGALAQPVDTLSFGVAESEKAHALIAELSEITKGGLEEPARTLLPREPVDWQGGKVAFTMQVDPALPNYFTLKLWGSDRTRDRLTLFCEGKQVGYRHLGDIDMLDIGGGEAGCAGRYYYVTTPLPVEMTKGKTSLQVEIRASGAVWGYAAKWEDFQKVMKEPTRGIYAGYTHTDGFFAPPSGEKAGCGAGGPTGAQGAGRGGGGPRYPGDMHSAHPGEKLPIAKIPAGIDFKPGQESIHAGKASFYQLRYGPYLIGMNTTKDKTFALKTPPSPAPVPELISQKKVTLTGELSVAPRTTVVLFLGGTK